MARPGFKEWMNELTNNQYNFLERPIYILCSALLELYVLFKFESVTDVAWKGCSSTLMLIASWWMTLSGIYMMIQAKKDMLHVPSDPLGFGFINSLSK